MDYAAEQEMELEALEAILMDDLSRKPISAEPQIACFTQILPDSQQKRLDQRTAGGLPWFLLSVRTLSELMSFRRYT